MSSIPAVLDALVQLWRADAPGGLRPDQVFDGPPAGEYVGTEGVAVGASLDDNDGVTFATPIADLRGGPREQFTVTCLAWSGAGDAATKPRRDRVAAILWALEASVAANRTLGVPGVSRVWLTSGAFRQQQGRGALVTVEFRLDVTRL